jgi:uncharacterized protein
MKRFGLTDSQIQAVKGILQRRLGDRKELRIWVFGSRARGTQRPYSDLDLLVEATPHLSKSERDSLMEAFEESELPFKVDLVLAEELLAAYHSQVMAERVPF